MITRKLLTAGALAAGLVASTAGVAAANASQHASAARPAMHHVTAAHHLATAKARSSGEDPSQEVDNPGGHQDPNGQNVDHQFEGVE